MADVSAHISCFSCGKVFRVDGEGVYACPHCGTHNRYQSNPTQAQGEPLAKKFSPWEEGWRSSFVHSFITTAKGVLFSPVSFFRGLTVSSRFAPVVTFSVTSQTIGYLASIAFQIGMALLQPALFGVIFQEMHVEDLIGGLITPISLLCFAVLIPALAFIGIVFSTALNHFMLWILRGNRNGLEATLHAVCYSSAANLFLVVPLFGGMVAGIWQLVLMVIGLKELHGIPYWKSVLAILLPILICCIGISILVGIGMSMLIPLIMQQTKGAF